MRFAGFMIVTQASESFQREADNNARHVIDSATGSGSTSRVRKQNVKDDKYRTI